MGKIEEAYRIIERLAKECTPAIIFGTKGVGRAIQKLLSANHVCIVCFCDNNKELQGKAIDGVMVYSPEEAFLTVRGAVVIVSAINSESRKSIFSQLSSLGQNKIYSWELFYFVYLCGFKKRHVNYESFYKALNSFADDDHVVIDILTMPITQRCSLKCRYCSYFLAYIENPIHFDKHSLVNNLKKLAESVDVIRNLVIIGGEAFTHPDIDFILSETSKISNILLIDIITNCTIIPSAGTTQIISENGIFIEASDYGKLSTKFAGLKMLCESNDIYFSVTSVSKNWSDCTSNEKHNRTDEENRNLFKHCFNRRNCNQLYKGEFHFCQMSSMKMDLEMIPRTESSDYVNISDESLDRNQRRQMMRDLLSQTTFVSACDYCQIGKSIPSAEQADKVLRYKKYY